MDIKAMLLAHKGELDLERIRADGRLLLTPESWNELDRLLDEYGSELQLLRRFLAPARSRLRLSSAPRPPY